MKIGRQSKNLEVQTDKQKIAAEHGLRLQRKALGNKNLKEPTDVKDWGDARDPLTKAMTNPGISKSIAPTTKTGAERRNLKDPKPTPFLKHVQKDTQFK